MSPLSQRAQEPASQITAMLAMLTSVLVLTWASTHGQTIGEALLSTAFGYGAVLAGATAWLRVDPFAVALSSARITAALVLASCRALAGRRRARRGAWA